MHYGSTYIVFYAPEAFGAVHTARIESPSFQAVEDYALAHAPEGYHVSSIEKVYGTADWLRCFGPVEIDLHEEAVEEVPSL